MERVCAGAQRGIIRNDKAKNVGTPRDKGNKARAKNRSFVTAFNLMRCTGLKVQTA
jgi:hypothetical protein